MTELPSKNDGFEPIISISAEQANILQIMKKIDRSLQDQETLIGHLQRCADDASLTPNSEWLGRMLRLTLQTAGSMGIDPQLAFEAELQAVSKAVAAGEKFDGNPYWRVPAQC